MSGRITRVGSTSPSWRTDLFSDSFPAMVNAVIRVLVYIRVRNENVESARGDILRVRSLSSYLSGHFAEMSGVSPHPMNEDLLTELISSWIVVFSHSPASEHRWSWRKRVK